jgi:hypothetical protein
VSTNADEQRPLQTSAVELLDAKVWEHLGLTGEEFRRKWWAGEYRDDPRPRAAVLDHLMRTGQWELCAASVISPAPVPAQGAFLQVVPG